MMGEIKNESLKLKNTDMKKIFQTPLFALIALMFAGMTFSGCVETCYDCSNPPPPPCTYGPNGVAGPAYFGLDWTADQPDYVWTNNLAIPEVFYYGDYYNSLSGSYQLYYEGQIMEGCCLKDYFWEVNFDVWVNLGTSGGCGFAGTDGLPSYLMLIMGPYGPGEHRTNKTDDPNKLFQEISRTDDEIVLQHTDGDINVRATFKKLSSSKRASLDAAGVKTAGTK